MYEKYCGIYTRMFMGFPQNIHKYNSLKMHKKAIGLVPRKARTVDDVCSTYCSSLVIRNMWSDGCSGLPRNQDQRGENPQHK